MRKLLLLGICIGLLTACNTNTAQSNLSVSEFEKEIDKGSVQVLDVRTPGEFQSGHLKGAMLADWNNQTVFKERVKALDKSKPVYTYCLGGGRSSAATEWLTQNGFTAYNLSGGINAWKNADKPVEMAEMKEQMSMEAYMAQIPANKTVLVDISAVWCPPCRKMAPLIEDLVKTNGNQFTLVKVDGGEQSVICKELNVEAFPTFIIYKNGKETWRKEGLVDTKELIANF